MQTEFGIILQGQTEQLSDMVLAFEVPQLNWMQAYTCSILVREPHAMDWMTSDTTVEALNGSRFVNFSDPSRVFIGRALTEARIRSGAKKKTVVIKSHMDSAQEFFDSPDTVVIANSAGEVIAKTVRVGLLGDSLIACVTLPADADVQSLLWIVNVEQEPLAYTIEEIQ